MYCSKCGNVIDDEAVICPKCGCATNNFNKANGKETGLKMAKEAKNIALVGLLILGPILGAIAVMRSNSSKEYTGGELCKDAKFANILGAIELIVFPFIYYYILSSIDF